MLQDIAPHTYHVEFTPAEPQPADLLLIYGPQGVLSAADALRLPVRADFPDIAVHFAFRLDDRAVFLAREPVEAPEGWRYVPSVTYRDAEPRETAFACATGESLQRWYAANRFCGRCGALMTENPAERAMTCPVCHKNVYPRINPAVIVAVLDHGRLLMTKYATRPLIRRYALIAGFCEMVARILVAVFFVPMFGFTAAAFASPVAWFAADAFLFPCYFKVMKQMRQRMGQAA